MQFTIQVISKNYTEIKKYIINFYLSNISDLLIYLYENNMIYTHDYSIYYNSKIIETLDFDKKLQNIDLIISQNNMKSCSCCIEK